MKKIVMIAVLFSIFIALSFVSAHDDCSFTVKAKTTSSFLIEIPAINTQLQTCPQELPVQIQKLIKDGIFWVEITDADDVYANINAGHITSVTKGTPTKYDYKATLSSCAIDNMLQKENAVGAFAAFYLSGKANLGASGFTNKIKLWFGKLFLKSALKKQKIEVSDSCEAAVRAEMNETNKTKSVKEPVGCFETYMQGHAAYQSGKAQWDAWYAETGHVCQTQTSKRPEGCKYLYEEIQNNDKKWVCWY